MQPRSFKETFSHSLFWFCWSLYYRSFTELEPIYEPRVIYWWGRIWRFFCEAKFIFYFTSWKRSNAIKRSRVEGQQLFHQRLPTWKWCSNKLLIMPITTDHHKRYLTGVHRQYNNLTAWLVYEYWLHISTILIIWTNLSQQEGDEFSYWSHPL